MDGRKRGSKDAGRCNSLETDELARLNMFQKGDVTGRQIPLPPPASIDLTEAQHLEQTAKRGRRERE